ncbi:MAG: oligopeptide transporter permease protein [Actinomycetia bacterium]|nr:oligopeptide transporter permease protein [Actinomycetes bacterium]
MNERKDSDVSTDPFPTSGDERRLDLDVELERDTEGVWTPSSLPSHDEVPPHIGFWKRFRRNKVALVAAIYLVLLVLAAVFAKQLVPQNPNVQNLLQVNAKPSGAHWFGQDDLGRDVFARIIYGARISLEASFLAVALALVVALPLGLVAGFVGGWVDQVLMRISDAIQVIPALVLALVISGILGPSTTNVGLALAIVFAPGFVRLVRGQVIGVREETYIEASRSIGAKPLFIIRKRVLHNVASPLIVQAAVTFGFALLAEASLSFLGLGVQAPDASWGTMLSRAFAQVYEAGWLLWIPGGAIAITVLAFNLIGDGLRDALGTETRGA